MFGGDITDVGLGGKKSFLDVLELLDCRGLVEQTLSLVEFFIDAGKSRGGDNKQT